MAIAGRPAATPPRSIRPDAKLGAGDVVIVLGESQQIDGLRTFLGTS